MGLGYIGLPTASMFASYGIPVTGVDVNESLLHDLNQGEIHIKEQGLESIALKALRSGMLTVNNQPGPADAFIIAVPTPFSEGKKADMQAVISATEMIVPWFPSLDGVLDGAELIMVLVRHRQFQELTPALIAPRTPARLVIDAVNLWGSDKWAQAGFVVHTLGDGSAPPTLPI